MKKVTLFRIITAIAVIINIGIMICLWKVLDKAGYGLIAHIAFLIVHGGHCVYATILILLGIFKRLEE